MRVCGVGAVTPHQRMLSFIGIRSRMKGIFTGDDPLMRNDTHRREMVFTW